MPWAPGSAVFTPERSCNCFRGPKEPGTFLSFCISQDVPAAHHKPAPCWGLWLVGKVGGPSGSLTVNPVTFRGQKAI